LNHFQRHKMKKNVHIFNVFCFFVLFLNFFPSLQAQQLRSPDDFLPHHLGEQFTPHHLLVDYYQHVARHSRQVQLKEYGRTSENRPLLYAVISSPENMANLEALRINHLRKTGLVEGTPTANSPAVVWMSMNVHGNEPASSETSMDLLHHLVNPAEKEIQNWLKNTIVIIDPCVNPDGYSRYTHWYMNASDNVPNPHPDAREHREPWPEGRYNHYLFDLNRDWAWATQVETQRRLEVYHQWMPQVVPDFHEMQYSEPYYFAPAAPPYHRSITPFQRDFQVEIGKNHAKYFDKAGWLYFSKEIFDLFYPGYGDTYPTFNGAIGMTYEQGGIRAGRTVLLENGNFLTLKDRIQHHLKTALSTLEMASKNADRLNKNFEAFFQKSQKSPSGLYQSYIIKKNNSKDKIKSLCTLLDRHKIKYGTVKSASQMNGFDYINAKESVNFNVSEGDLVINARQPMGILTQVLFDPSSEIADSLTYDITAWALPYAYGLETYASKKEIEVNAPYPFAPAMVDVKSTETAYAYIMRWQSLSNAHFLSLAVQRGIKVRAAREPFEIEGKTYQSGTLVFTRADNMLLGERFDREMTALALQNEQDLTAVYTGFVSKGRDFGSERLDLLTKPAVAVLYDDDVDENGYGQVWHFFETELKMPITPLRVMDVGRVKLSSFNVIVMTDGKYSKLDSLSVIRLKTWVSEGGKLILIGDALSLFEDKKDFVLTKFASKKDEDIALSTENSEKMRRRYAHFCDAERDAASDNIPGAIFKVSLDNSHPLGYGLGNTYYSLKTSNNAYQVLKNVWNVGYIGKDLQVFGFAGQRVREAQRNTSIFSVQSLRRGHVVYMTDNPLFRAFWYQGKFLFANAVLMKMK
jgi:Zinc carboxypeptidase